jgi:hypothetical protein
MLGENYTPEDLEAILHEANYHLGRVLFESGKDFDRAVSLLGESIKRDPENIPAHYYYGKAILAQVEHNALMRAEDALKHYLEQGAPIGHADEVRDFLMNRALRRGEIRDPMLR